MTRLVEPVSQLDHYVALSHIWGKSITFLTTRDTFAAKKRVFNLHETPPTFRDAILVTRALGIRYLWIDSLYYSRRPVRLADRIIEDSGCLHKVVLYNCGR